MENIIIGDHLAMESPLEFLGESITAANIRIHNTFSLLIFIFGKKSCGNTPDIMGNA
jgi:hypothetical protein